MLVFSGFSKLSPHQVTVVKESFPNAYVVNLGCVTLCSFFSYLFFFSYFMYKV